jgi:hypothetical protein
VKNLWIACGEGNTSLARLVANSQRILDLITKQFDRFVRKVFSDLVREMMRLLLLLLSYAVSAKAFFAVAPLSSARGGAIRIVGQPKTRSAATTPAAGSTSSSLHMVKFNGEKWVAEKPEETGEAGYPLMNTWFLHGPKPFFTRIFQPDDYEQVRLPLLLHRPFGCWSSCSMCTTKSPGSVEYMWYILSRHSHYFFCDDSIFFFLLSSKT